LASNKVLGPNTILFIDEIQAHRGGTWLNFQPLLPID
jgi:hypothetical protein